ncbi:MAG TPA: hypothetical protein VMU42_12030 [Candidatus Sulfotelmatobacter sp.]|nr:hypothetical protein [Candidatus Sulfotelmatobacter sp.]
MQRRSLFAAAGGILLLPFTARIATATSKVPRQTRRHSVAFHVDVNDPALMTMALHNVSNLASFYSGKGDEVAIELVAYGPGLHMLRADTSPVKAEIKSIAESIPGTVFSACHNTRAAMAKREGKEIPLLPQAREVPAGVVRLVELQEQGWSYVKP